MTAPAVALTGTRTAPGGPHPADTGQPRTRHDSDMTAVPDAADGTTPGTRAAQATCEALVANRLGPYLATPDGILAPLLDLLEAGPDTDYRVISREENAVGIAAGIGLAGGRATVLLQNSGLGLSVNALASLAIPYRVPLLLVVSQRGTGEDTTAENLPMGALTAPILDALGIEHVTLGEIDDAESSGTIEQVIARQIAAAATAVRAERQPYALLVPPALFGWTL